MIHRRHHDVANTNLLPTASDVALLQDQPNPFAQFAATSGSTPALTPSRPARQSLKRSAIRWVLIASMAAGIAVAITHSPRYLVAYLKRDLGELSPPDREARLLQIASIGPDGLPVIIEQFAIGDAQTSQICERLLSESQNSWTTLPTEVRLQRHRMLLDVLNENVERSPVTRHRIMASVLRQSVQDLAVRDEPAAVSLRQALGTLASRLSAGNVGVVLGDSASGASQIEQTGVDDDGGLNSNLRSAPTLLARRAPAIFAARVSEDAAWTQWPPDQPSDGDLVDASLDPPPALRKVVDPSIVVLRPVPRPSEMVEAKEMVDFDNEPSDDPVAQEPASHQIKIVSEVEILPAWTGEVPPMKALADVSVFVYLHSEDAKVRSAAELELQSRGYNPAALQLARIVGSPDPNDRALLANELPRLSLIDPRPWLVYLCNDPDRRVRMQAISVVATYDDAEAKMILRNRLNEEDDVQISQKIRRFLDL